MFKKILLATTGTSSCDAAARVAFDLARRYDAELFVIHVFGVPDRSFSQTVTDIRTGQVVDLHDDIFKDAEDEIRKIYEHQIEHYKEPVIEVMTGIPHTEVLRMARKQDIDLIITGARTEQDAGEGLSNRHIAGRTLQGVARAARCPVLVIGRPAASFWGGISSIVFGTDFSKASDSAFLFAVKLARAFKCKLHIFHAVDISADAFGISKNQEVVDDSIHNARDIIRNKYTDRMDGVDDYEVDVWEGIPYVEIVKFAREQFADLIIMAHHTARINPNEALLGSTMEQVVLRSNCPVISVNHPDKIDQL